MINAAAAAHRAGRATQAAAMYEQILAHRPHAHAALFGLAQLRASLGDLNESIRLHEAAAAASPKTLRYQLGLAYALLGANRADEAMKRCDRALRLDPNSAPAHHVKALLHERRHEVDEAVAAARRALALQPGSDDAAIDLARMLDRRGDRIEARDRLLDILPRLRTADQRYKALKQLAMIHDRLGEYDSAFDCMVRGNREGDRSGRALKSDLHQIPRAIDDYHEGLTRDLLSRSQHGTDDEPPDPVFLVGFARSGTTMLEQILAAHAQIETAGERLLVHALAREIAVMFPEEPSMPRRLERLTTEQISRLRESYWRRAAQEMNASPGEVTFIDKGPLDIVDIGLINVIFPNAKVIVAVRDPRDVCISCFMQHFELNAGMAHFLDWERTAAFYGKVMGFWLHVRAMLTLKWMEVRYEDLVRDFPENAAAILAFLESPWDNSVLRFHEIAAKRIVTSPSFVAVTEKTHTRAIGRWKNYESRFEPSIMHHIQPAIAAFGYERRE